MESQHEPHHFNLSLLGRVAQGLGVGMNNCAPGQMAITKGALMDNGLIVDVLESAGVFSGYGQLWWVESKGSPFHLTPTEMSHKVVWPDTLLIPIRPGDLEDETPAVREMEAV